MWLGLCLIVLGAGWGQAGTGSHPQPLSCAAGAILQVPLASGLAGGGGCPRDLCPPSLCVCLCHGGFGCRTGIWDWMSPAWGGGCSAAPKPICQLWTVPHRHGRGWQGLGAATPGSMHVSSSSLALREVGRLFFFLYHPVCFKPCHLHGCRHHLLLVLAYNSWLDLGLFLCC